MCWASQERAIWALERPAHACTDFYGFGVEQKQVNSHITFVNLLKSEGLMYLEGLAQKVLLYIPSPITPSSGREDVHSRIDE